MYSEKRKNCVLLIALEWEAIIVNVCVFVMHFFLLDSFALFQNNIWFFKWLFHALLDFSVISTALTPKLSLLFKQNWLFETRWQGHDKRVVIISVEVAKLDSGSRVSNPNIGWCLSNPTVPEFNCAACHSRAMISTLVGLFFFSFFIGFFF